MMADKHWLERLAEKKLAEFKRSAGAWYQYLEMIRKNPKLRPDFTRDEKKEPK